MHVYNVKQPSQAEWERKPQMKLNFVHQGEWEGGGERKRILHWGNLNVFGHEYTEQAYISRK